MKTKIHFWSYLTHFVPESKMFQTKVVEKIKTHILCLIIFFFENRSVYEIMWKNIFQLDRAQMIIWHMRVACWIPKCIKYTHNMLSLFFFHYNNGCTDAPLCYVVRTLSVCLSG